MSVQKFLYGLFIDFWQKSFSFSISKWTVYLPTQHKKTFLCMQEKVDAMVWTEIYFFLIQNDSSIKMENIFSK